MFYLSSKDSNQGFWRSIFSKTQKTHSLPDSIQRSPTSSASSFFLSSRLQSNFPPNSQTHTLSHSQFTVHNDSDGLALPGHSTGGVAVLPQRRCVVRREPHRHRFRSPRHHSGTTFSHYFAFFFLLFFVLIKKLDALAMKRSKNHN